MAGPRGKNTKKKPVDIHEIWRRREFEENTERSIRRLDSAFDPVFGPKTKKWKQKQRQLAYERFCREAEYLAKELKDGSEIFSSAQDIAKRFAKGRKDAVHIAVTVILSKNIGRELTQKEMNAIRKTPLKDLAKAIDLVLENSWNVQPIFEEVSRIFSEKKRGKRAVKVLDNILDLTSAFELFEWLRERIPQEKRDEFTVVFKNRFLEDMTDRFGNFLDAIQDNTKIPDHMALLCVMRPLEEKNILYSFPEISAPYQDKLSKILMRGANNHINSFSATLGSDKELKSRLDSVGQPTSWVQHKYCAIYLSMVVSIFPWMYDVYLKDSATQKYLPPLNEILDRKKRNREDID